MWPCHTKLSVNICLPIQILGLGRRKAWQGLEAMVHLLPPRSLTSVLLCLHVRCQAPSLSVMPKPLDISSWLCSCSAERGMGPMQEGNQGLVYRGPRGRDRTYPLTYRINWSHLKDPGMNRKINLIQRPKTHLHENLVWEIGEGYEVY